MRRTIHPYRLLVAGLLALALGQAAYAGPTAPEVPDALQVEQGHKLVLVAHAVGVQIYRCDWTSEGFTWTFVAPRADLFGDNGKLLGTHFGGPTWQARDGSFVRATRVDGVTVDTTAIAWLLLRSTATGAGPGGDRFAGTTYIQRIATAGGLAPPAEACGAATVGETAEVPYTADYTFWRTR